MKSKTYTPSINIIRDFDEEFNYIPTPNAQQVYNQIISNYQKGGRSFSLIGSYGTGKSSYVLALEHSLNGRNSYFNRARLFNEINEFHFLNIIGENKSLITSFAENFGLESKDYSPGQVIKTINNFYQGLNNQALVIVIDEFGKFLEYAARNNPEKELYFIQQLAEFVNTKGKEILLITILHKNFNAYSLELSQNQIDEWNKVRGRLIELNFNEPVEQLLFLAAEKLAERGYDEAIVANVEKVHSSIERSMLYPLKDYNNLLFSKRILPFDLLSAAILTVSLQEYAQNERSLFSFIENDDEFGLNKFDRQANPFYNLSCVYDYLTFYHFSFLTTKYNPHLNQWNTIKFSIERAEVIIKNNLDDAIKLIKTIGLLNIFSFKGGVIDEEFINDYGIVSLGIQKPLNALIELENHKIIRFSKYDKRYKLLHGTDLDFELAINEAGQLVERITDVTFFLQKYFDFPVITAKEVSFSIGTPRMFSFVLSNEPILDIPEEELDGFINLIFGLNFNEESIKIHSLNCQEAILFGYYTKTEKIEETIFEIEKVKKVIENNIDDLIAVQELENILRHYRSLLNHFVLDSLYSGDGSVKWFFNGEQVQIKSQREFNHYLSSICYSVYKYTPTFKNEMVNKTKLSGSISLARKNLITQLLKEELDSDLGLDNQKFPPEKTIFLSLIKSTGILQEFEGGFYLSCPTESSFLELWNDCMIFMDSTLDSKKPIVEFISYLKKRPFKLKQGFIDFWLPLFLLINKNDFAIFQIDRNSGAYTYIPQLNEEVLELINKSPRDFVIKKFDLTPTKLELFNKYREILNQIEQAKFSNKGFIETFRPFLVFHKSLNTFAKSTKRLSNKSIQLREVITNAIDPEQAFFEDFPGALGYNFLELSTNDVTLEEFTITIKESIQEINNAYDVLLNELESFINIEIFGEQLDFPHNKSAFKRRYEKLKPELLKPNQKVFYNRLVSVLNDRKSWINSISQATIGKSLENISDEEIGLIKHNIIENIRELDNYTELSEKDIDPEKEEIIKLEITTLLKGLSKKFIRIPKSKYEKIATLEKLYKEQLKGNDNTVNIALLIRLLQDELGNEDES